MAEIQSFQRPLWRIKPRERKVILFTGDLTASVIALIFALFFWAIAGREWMGFSFNFLSLRVPFWFYLLPAAWLLMLIELYDIARAANRRLTFRDISLAALFSFALYLVIYFTSSDLLPRRGVAGFIVAAYLLTMLWRFAYINIFTSPPFMRRVLIVGAGRAGTRLVEVVRSLWPPPFFVVGLIDDDTNKIGHKIEEYAILGGSNDLLRIARENHVTDIVFAITGDMHTDMFTALLEAEEKGIQVTTMPMVYEELLGRVPIFLLQSDWVLRVLVDQAHIGGLDELLKRLMDLVGAVIGFVALCVFTPLVGLGILLESGWPIFYSQDRVGRNGRVYRIIKFRTMSVAASKEKVIRPTQESDIRVTRFGNFLRKSHIDELPQIINVLRGEMSLVGPRSEVPNIVRDLQDKVPFYRARLFAKPGVTGWAQINYGYAATIEQNAVKLEYDLYYIKHRSLFLDIMIILRTVGSVIGLRGR